MFEVYVPNVSSRFSDVCLQVFHLDVAYVFTHIKCFQVFFASVLYACFECLKCFVRMLQVFHLDVSKVDIVLQLVFQMHVSCVLSAFRRMLQVLDLDVSKIDRVLCYLTFALVFPPPPGTGWTSAAPSPSLGCWRSHLL
jgi:hypothetical protein